MQYRANDRGTHRGRWQVRAEESEPWLFDGLRDGSLSSSAGIEIDARAPSSPRQTRIVAVIPNVFGPGISANMSYYETRAGAKVFAAGAFSFAAAIWQPPIRQMAENLWARLATE